MKANYKNWMPKGMILGTLLAAVVCLALFVLVSSTQVISDGTPKMVIKTILLILSIITVLVTIWMYLMYRAFSYDGKRQMSKQIIEGIAEYVKIPDGGKCLDVGCGSGALTIACAKRNPNATVVGVDRWGKEYASFSKSLCERNAQAEGVSNTSFEQGDATKLTFSDETFDAVTSNYVYHNIMTRDKQALLLETLRTLKKGGTFAIHDIMSKGRYGDMEVFADRLKDMGYEKVEIIDTTNGKFMSKFESVWMDLAGSKLLVGKK